MTPELPVNRWTKSTRDRWFFGILIASLISVVVLLQPFIYVLGLATVTVIVTWPLFQRILARVRRRRTIAAILTTLVVGTVIGGPLAFFVFLFVRQTLEVVSQGVAFVESGRLAAWITWVSATENSDLIAAWAPHWAASYLTEMVPADLDFQKLVTGPVQQGALGMLGAIGSFAPTLLTSTIHLGLGALIYVGAVVTLYMEGPVLVGAVRNLSPIDARYETRLFEVFREMSNNMVVGALAIALIQATVAGIGYTIFGVERAFFFAILTGALSFVPFFGTMVVWVPLTILVAAQDGLGWGGGLALWSIICTGQIDNLVRPFFMRGSTHIHPLFIGLAAFGGISWLGVPGAIVGPMVVAFFLALYTIYVKDFLPGEAAAVAAADRGTMPAQ